MKKLAFTLAEVLITLSIIGVIAAIAAPAISSAKPDATKMQYLKIYDHLTQITKDLAGNGLIFAPLFPSNDGVNCSNAAGAPIYNVSYVPLMNICTSQDQRFRDFNGVLKFAFILADVLGSEDAQQSDVREVDFSTPDGVGWSIAYNNDPVGANRRFYYQVIIDLDLNAATGFYSANMGNRKPDLYRFYISADGAVYPADECGQMFVATRLNPSSRENFHRAIANGHNGTPYTNEALDNYPQLIITPEDYPRIN